MKLKTIKELYEKVKSGEIDESKLKIVLDDDCTFFYVGPSEDDKGEEIDNEIVIEEANGFYDIDKLYSLLFPKSDVNWC